jgi:hypothetical protein
MRYKINQYLRKNKDLKGIVKKKSRKDFCTKCKLFFKCGLQERWPFVFSSLLKYFNRFSYRSR